MLNLFLRILTLPLVMVLVITGCAKEEKSAIAKKGSQPIVRIALDDLGSMTLNYGKQQLVFMKETGQWVMTIPESAPVDHSQLIEFWQQIQGLAGQLVDQPDELELINQELAKKEKIVIIKFIDQQKQVSHFQVLTDKLKRALLYIKNINENKIYKLDTDDWLDLENWAITLPDRFLIPYNISDIKRLIYRHEDSVIDLERYQEGAATSWKLLNPQQRSVPIESVERLLTIIEDLKYLKIAQTSVWGKIILSQYGFHKPTAQLTIVLEGSRVPKTLQFAEPEQEEGMLYAKYQDETKIFSVPNNLSKDLLNQFEKILVERKLITYMHLVSKVVCYFPSYQRQLLKQQNQWMAFKLDPGQHNTYEETEIGKEEADAVVFILNHLTYDVEVDPGSEAYQDYSHANHFGSIKFYTKIDEPLITIMFSQHDKLKNSLFLKDDRNGRVRVIGKDKLKPFFIKDN